MKRTRIDKLGRIVIPIDFRRALEINTETELKVCLDGNQITIYRASSCCKLCNRQIDVNGSVELCQRCIERVKRL